MRASDGITGCFAGTERKSLAPFLFRPWRGFPRVFWNGFFHGAVFLTLLCSLAAPGWVAPATAKNSTANQTGQITRDVQAPQSDPALPDALEKATGLVKLSGERFILDLKYASAENFLGQDVYSPFGLAACYVHPDLRDKLATLHALLAAEGLRLVIYDCFRPIEVQQAMWKILPDSRYVANPARGSLHNRGIAVDCALADESGNPLEFPTGFDSFEKKAWQNYVCSKPERKACVNRDRLRKLMQDAGLVPIRTEWWHFQLPNTAKYPLVSIYGLSESEGAQ